MKNIARPVRTYQVRLEGSAGVWRFRARQHVRRARVVGGALAVLLLAAGTAWWLWPTESARAKPAIAVLPFDNYGGDEATGRLADGITEDIVTDLARFRNLDVIARNSTEVYKGKPVDVREVGKDLGVGYVLEGSIQRQDDRLRTTAQLIDASTGAHIWSDRWDRRAEDIFEVQTEMADRIAAALGGDLTMGQITRAELERAKRRRPADLTAYDYFLLGEEAKSKVTPESVRVGIEYLNKAIELDPTFARAYSVRAWLHNFSLMTGVDWETALGRMVADAEKSVDLDPRDAESVAALGAARALSAQPAEAESLLRTAVDMAPANSHVLVIAAGMFSAISLPEEAAGFADRAMRLDPRMTPANLWGVSDAYYMARRYEDTIAAVSKIPEASRTRAVWLFLTGSYVRLDQDKEAAQAKAKLLAAYPEISAERMLNEDYFPWPKNEDTEHFVNTFRAAELPLCLSAEELRQYADPNTVPECDAQRAAAAIAKT